ncbi:MAG: hypothetical protein ABIA62_05140 [Candidatus Woesearchaeota archaeon]
MTFKGKQVKVVIVGQAKEDYAELNRLVGEETAKGITKSEHQTLFNSIKQKVEFLKENPEYGIHVEKRKIPKEYVLDYDATNIWKVNLSGYWRMIYTIRGTEVDIIAVVLDILDHKAYDKKFGYKSR